MLLQPDTDLQGILSEKKDRKQCYLCAQQQEIKFIFLYFYKDNFTRMCQNLVKMIIRWRY